MSKYLLLPACFILFTTTLWAQPTLPDEEVDVIKDFEATLEESEKIDLTPELPALDTSSRQLTYALPTKTIQLEYLPPKLRPLAIRRQAVPESYDGYVKLGYGTPNRPYAELAYNNTKDERYDIGGHLKYHTANRKAREHQRMQDIGGNLNGSYYFDEGYAVSGLIGYQLDEVHFYGYDNDTRMEVRDDVRQQFNTFHANAKFFNGVKTQGDINYHAGFDLYNMSDNYASSEFGFDLELGMTKWFSELHPLTVLVDADFTRFENGEAENLNNIGVRPSFTFHGDIFKAKIGLNGTANDDNFNLFPDAEILANVVGNQLAAYIGATGGLYKNNFRNLSDYNPFVISKVDIRNTKYYKFYGGVKGNLRVVDYQVQASYKIANDMALFAINPADSLRFAPLYDTVDVFSLEGTVTANPRDDIRLLATLSQNYYNPKNQEKAWFIPSTQLNAGVYYTTLRDKLEVRGELFVENGVPYITTNGTEDRLGALFDMNLGAIYKFNKRINFFLDLNNVFNNERERWKGYDIYGFNVLGGVTAKF